MMSRPVISAILGAVLVMTSGCTGGSDQKTTAKVSGTVTYNGSPLRKGNLVFFPVGGGPSAEGNINEDGTYTMGTYSESDGAIPGTHEVMITSMTQGIGSGLAEDSVKMPTGPQSLIPEHFSSQKDSGLKAEVKAGSNIINFILDDKTGTVEQK